MFENKVIEDNKILISNLKARMFRGYHKVAKKSKSLMHKKNNENNINLNPFYTPIRKEKKELDSYTKTYTNHFPTKIIKEILPYQDEYQDIYKNKYLSKYNNLQLNDLYITNLSKSNKKNKNLRNKIENNRLNESKNLRNFQNIINNIEKKEIDKNNQKRTINLLFPYKEEINQYSNLPFFSLTKNPNNLQSALSSSREGNEKNMKNMLQEDFLYKISHRRENETKYINNNFIKNKGIKRGGTIPFNEFNLINKKKLKLQLDILNINNNKNKYLNSKEKRYKILEKEMEPLKNIVSLFKEFENNFLEDEDNGKNIDEKYKNKIINVDINKEENLKTDIKQNIISGKNFDDEFKEAYRTTYNFKKPKFYPINYYSSSQLKRKENKYEKIHKLAFEEYQKKINIKEESRWKRNKRNYELDEYEKEYFNKLFNKREMTNKIAFMRECRIRDIIITNKLKCEFSPSDIKRLLNGLKPWNDCQKLDEQFMMKKIPKKLDDLRIN